MYGQTPKVIIGEFVISQMSDEDENSVWIENGDGEGAEFQSEKLESFLKEFWNKNF